MVKTRYKENIRVTTYDVDQNKIAKASGVWQLLQEAASQQMKVQKPSYTDLLSEGKALMLARADISIPEKIFLDDVVEITSWPCPSTRATFPRNYEMLRNGKTVAQASTQWSLVDVRSRKILKCSEVDFSNYYIGEYHELVKGKFRISQDEEQAMETVGEKTVRFSDIDYNGHMNNTYYLDLVCDYIPELEEGTYRVSFIRIHYSKEAPLRDVITVKRLGPINCETSEEKERGEKKYIFQTFKADGELNIETEITIKRI